MKRALIVLLLLAAGPVFGHELRPAYLDLREVGDGEYRVLWKTPMRGNLRLSLHPVFSASTAPLTPVTTRHVNSAAVQAWRIRTLEPLRGRSVRIAGLETTMTDALVRMEFSDGVTWTKRLTPAEPAARIPVRPSGWGIAREYLMLGIGHILGGIDHLLFVLALLLITRGGWKLFKTITAFTVAHSITLGLATLGVVRIPTAPVEALIALSIVFVATEIVRVGQGHETLTFRAPWLMAFTFGLLHGFGFAGTLSAIGLPQVHIPLALLFFNLGVEAAQLLFVAAVLTLVAATRWTGLHLPRTIEVAPAYAIGSVSMFWVVQRVAAF